MGRGDIVCERGSILVLINSVVHTGIKAKFSAEYNKRAHERAQNQAGQRGGQYSCRRNHNKPLKCQKDLKHRKGMHHVLKGA